jgi:nucleoside diphosphate kinase
VELGYVLITPYSIIKSRTGGIIARLMTLTDLELAGARMYAPSDAFMDEYSQTIRDSSLDEYVKSALIQYVDENLRPQNRLGMPNRTLLLLFKGKNAVKVLNQDGIGPLSPEVRGDTLRATFGDFLGYPGGQIKHFEPAVLTADDPEMNARQLEILARYAEKDGGILEHVISFSEGVTPETTLVILKPENFQRHSSRPGNIIDVFSKTGLYIVAAKLLKLSVAQGEQLYQPIRQALVEKMTADLEARLRQTLQETFDFKVDGEIYAQVLELLKRPYGMSEFHRIVEFMTGVNPAEVTPDQRGWPGEQRCLALLYQGENAVRKIRERLGATDPSRAAPGTVRSSFGYDLMKNGAHASDSLETAERERKIVGLWKEDTCEVQKVIQDYLAQA